MDIFVVECAVRKVVQRVQTQCSGPQIYVAYEN